MLIIRTIDKAHEADLQLKNEPFPLFGLLLPAYQNGAWTYQVKRFPKENCTEMCFPDEAYHYDELCQNSILLGAYDGETCVGLAILRHSQSHFLYLYDLKVNAAYRRKRIGMALLDRAKALAQELGYRGLYTQGQDNNLGACLFYLKNGFVIGGLDTYTYKGTSQENKADVLFYYDAKEPRPGML